jgi:hypothetical protein
VLSGVPTAPFWSGLCYTEVSTIGLAAASASYIGRSLLARTIVLADYLPSFLRACRVSISNSVIATRLGKNDAHITAAHVAESTEYGKMKLMRLREAHGKYISPHFGIFEPCLIVI